MDKYSSEFKIEVVAEYLSGNVGLGMSNEKYSFKLTQQIRNCVNAYQALDINGFKRSRKKFKPVPAPSSSAKKYLFLT